MPSNNRPHWSVLCWILSGANKRRLKNSKSMEKRHFSRKLYSCKQKMNFSDLKYKNSKIKVCCRKLRTRKSSRWCKNWRKLCKRKVKSFRMWKQRKGRMRPTFTLTRVRLRISRAKLINSRGRFYVIERTPDNLRRLFNRRMPISRVLRKSSAKPTLANPFF